MHEMSDRQDNMTVWVGDDAVCIRITGRANLHASVEFKQVIQSLRNKGHLRFVLDLTDCRLMDSTFLGVLARLGIDAAVPVDDAPRVVFDLLNPNRRVQELLDTLGVREYFKYVQGQGDNLQCLEPMALPEPRNLKEPDCSELARTSLEAHEALMKVNPNNVAKFQDVAKYLAEELQGSGGKRGEPPDPASAPETAAN
jgi:anti-sigma B factor antagonist